MSKRKILTLDIETRPNLVYTFSLRKAYIGVEQIVAPSRIIAVGAKWHGQNRVMYWDDFDGTTDAALKKNLLEPIHKLWSQADAIIGKNSNRFDLPKLYGEFAKVGLKPPPPVASIDLEKTLRQMGLATTKLAFAAPYFGDKAGECPNCGSRDIQHRGYRRTRMFQTERLHCQTCGAWSSGTRRKV